MSGDGIVTFEVLRASVWQERGFDPTAAATTDVVYRERPDGSGWSIADADIYVQDGVGWARASGTEAPDLEAALAHEWLHSLGVAHCCESDGVDGAPRCEAAAHCEGQLMAPSHYGLPRALGDDDREALCFLYPAEPCMGDACASCGVDADCGEGSACVAGTCRDAAPTMPACTLDADCPPGRRCSDGVCRAAVVGDPCIEDAGCQGGLCASNGACTQPCANDGACPEDYACVAAVCEPLLETLGAACDRPSECTGRVCVEGSRTPAVCSRECSTLTPCPSGWECALVSSRRVCAPATPASGCAIAARPPSGPGLTAWAAICFVLLRARRRSRGAPRASFCARTQGLDDDGL